MSNCENNDVIVELLKDTIPYDVFMNCHYDCVQYVLYDRGCHENYNKLKLNEVLEHLYEVNEKYGYDKECDKEDLKECPQIISIYNGSIKCDFDDDLEYLTYNNIPILLVRDGDFN